MFLASSKDWLFVLDRFTAEEARDLIQRYLTEQFSDNQYRTTPENGTGKTSTFQVFIHNLFELEVNRCLCFSSSLPTNTMSSMSKQDIHVYAADTRSCTDTWKLLKSSAYTQKCVGVVKHKDSQLARFGNDAFKGW